MTARSELADGPNLYYEVHGQAGRYLLLVHGFLSSRAQWLPNLAPLAKFCRPVVVELFGHGRSPAPEDPAMYSPRHYVEEFEKVRKALGCERWLLLGQSLGAALTLRYALERPERLIGHVLTNSNSAFAEEGWGERVRPAMEAQARGLRERGRAFLDQHPLNPARARRLPDGVRRTFAEDVALHRAEGIALTGLHTVPDSSMRARVQENLVPSLLVVGEREERFAPHRRFAESAMPNLRVVGLDAGHAVNLDAPEQFNAAVAAFYVRVGV